MKAVRLNGESLTIREVAGVAARERTVVIDGGARNRVDRGVETVAKALDEKRVVYGVDTGFGELAHVSIGEDDLAALQLNLIRSHATATGDELGAHEVRAILLAKANALLIGLDGVRWEVIELLVKLIEKDILPVIPGIGSLGASGDLAQLAHLSLPLVGEGTVRSNGGIMPAAEALAKAGLAPVVLGPKEGLGLINGTQGITGLLSVALGKARNVLAHAEIAAALSTEALLGTTAAWDERLHAARPHPGGMAVAARLRALMKGSEILKSHAECGKVQDAYSVRCAPTVLGAVQDVLDRESEVVERELNSATGNPLCFPDEGDIISGGNFHGEPVAFSADFTSIVLTEVASIAERRVARLVDPKLSGLPAYLAGNPGLESGYMIAHYTAAALVAECKLLAHPSSTDSIPTSGNQEDHVSMGFHGARKALQIVGHVERTVAIEMLAAAQGIEYLRPDRSSEPLEAAMAVIREVVPPLDGDRSLSPDLDRLLAKMSTGEIVRAAGIHDL